MLLNAVKYTQKGKVLLTARRQGNFILLEVRDTGIGISTEQQSLIFSDFYRSNDSLEHGIGLGLGVVRRLSHQMDCKIQVESIVGRGSCFSMLLPIANAKTIRNESVKQKAKL